MSSECPWHGCLYSEKRGDSYHCKMEDLGFGCLVSPGRKQPKQDKIVIIKVPVNISVIVQPGQHVCDQDLVMIRESALEGVLRGLDEQLRGDIP